MSHTSEIRELHQYHLAEIESFRDLAAEGSLRSLNTNDGELFALPIRPTPIGIAAVIGNMIVQRGDVVILDRLSEDGGTATKATVSNFFINSETGEIEFADPDVPGQLRLRDVAHNSSVVDRFNNRRKDRLVWMLEHSVSS
jgi:hypothetical protein